MDRDEIVFHLGQLVQVTEQLARSDERQDRQLAALSRIAWTMLGALAAANYHQLAGLAVSLYNGVIH